MTATFFDNAKVMSKGQVTIPKDIRTILGINTGDKVTFVVEGNTVKIVNTAIYAMELLQNSMKTEPQYSEKEVEEMVAEVRK